MCFVSDRACEWRQFFSWSSCRYSRFELRLDPNGYIYITEWSYWHIATERSISRCLSPPRLTHYHALSRHSTSVRDERIITYLNVSARTKASQIGDSCNDVWIRSRLNREIYLDNLIGTFVIESKRAMKSWQIVSPEICLSWPYRFKAQQIA